MGKRNIKAAVGDAPQQLTELGHILAGQLTSPRPNLPKNAYN